MAISCHGSTPSPAYLVRSTGGFLSTAADFTVMLWGCYEQPTTPSDFHLLWQAINIGGSGGYVYLGTASGSDTIMLEVYDGTTRLDSGTIPIGLGNFHHATLTYNATTHVGTLYVDATLIGTVTLNLSSVTFTQENIGDDGTGYLPYADAGYFRSWQALLSPTEILAEMASPSAVRTANLFTDTRLQESSSLTDASGHGHTWTKVGSVSTVFPNLAVAATPVTATVITGSLPYSNPIDVSGSATSPAVPPNSTYFPTVTNVAWWKYTPAPGLTFLYLAAGMNTGADPSWSPYLTVWVERVPGVLIPYQLFDGGGDSQGFSGGVWGTHGGGWFRLPVTAGTPYWLELCQAFGFTATTSGALTVLELQNSPQLAIPGGAIVVSDDTDGFPAAAFSSSGTFYQYRPFPAGEFTDTQPTGEVATQNGSADASVAFLDASWNPVVIWPAPVGQHIVGIKSDRTGHFYVVTRGGTPELTVFVFTAAGTLLSTHPLPSDFNNGYCYAVSRDGTTWYQGSGNTGFSSVILVYSLATNTQLTSLPITTPGGWAGGQGDGYVAADGSIVFCRAGVSVPGHFERYNPTTGALLQSYSTTTVAAANHWAFADDIGPGHFVVWGYIGSTLTPAYFETIALDGTHVSTSPPIAVFGGSAQNNGDVDPNGISNSCPVFVVPIPVTTTASIQVHKVVSPVSGDTFNFIAGGGLTPTSFTLGHGGMQGFSSVPPGSGYSINETVPTGWTVGYAVSNGSPHTNITVAPGETVSVTVTNTAPGGGSGGPGLDCTTKILTITGTGFQPGASITVQGPRGDAVGFMLLSFSSTTITLRLDYPEPGEYRVSVVNPT